MFNYIYTYIVRNWNLANSLAYRNPPLCKGRWILRSKRRRDCLTNTCGRAIPRLCLRNDNPSVSFADSSLYTREPFRISQLFDKFKFILQSLYRKNPKISTTQKRRVSPAFYFSIFQTAIYFLLSYSQKHRLRALLQPYRPDVCKSLHLGFLQGSLQS